MAETLGFGRIVFVIALASCGRLRFDPLADAAADAAAATTLGCTGTRPPIIDLADPTLLGYWSFDDNLLPATDFSTRGVAAVPDSVAVPHIQPGGVGSALSLFGGIANANAPTGTYDLVAAGLTLEMWAKDVQTCNVPAWFVQGQSGSLDWQLGCGAGSTARMAVSMTTAGSAEVVSNTVVNDVTWHHLAGVLRGKRVEIWVDGVLEATAPANLPDPVGGTATAVFGPIATLVDEVRLWRAALAPDDITRIAATYRPGLVAYWSFDGGFAGFAGLGFDGTPLGDVAIGGGRAGGGATFGGVDGRIEVPLPDVFASSYTAMAWFRTPGNGQPMRIFDRESLLNQRAPVHLEVSEGGVFVEITDEPGFSIGGSAVVSVTDNCWHHVAVVREGGDGQIDTVRLYVDGVLLVTSSGLLGMTSDATDPFRIGYRIATDPRPFVGSIDEVQIYSRALSADEISGIYVGLR